MLANIKAACWNSLTMAWAYVQLAFGFVAENVDNIAMLVGDPSLNQQIQSALGVSPKALGAFTMFTGLVTGLARARSLIKPKA